MLLQHSLQDEEWMVALKVEAQSAGPVVAAHILNTLTADAAPLFSTLTPTRHDMIKYSHAKDREK